MEEKNIKQGICERYIKRMLDIVCSLAFLLLFWWGLRDCSSFSTDETGQPGAVQAAKTGERRKDF